MKQIFKFIRIQYSRVVNSIAFFPVLIALAYLTISVLMLFLDFSDTGKQIKSQWNLLRLHDAETARTIVSTVIGGMISVTVFSFSMVMIVLNQTASQLSNRILDNLIGNRNHQVLLGFYLGTIVYSFFLISSIRDIDEGVQIPALSIYLLMFFTVLDIFLFIYFLHYVTQSVRYQTLINRIRQETHEEITKNNRREHTLQWTDPQLPRTIINAPENGYYQGFDHKELLSFLKHENLYVRFLVAPGNFMLRGTPLFVLFGNIKDEEHTRKRLHLTVDFYRGQPISRNAAYGFRHLSEVAIKALSPGINDPATAVLCMEALVDLLSLRLEHPPAQTLLDDDNTARIAAHELSFESLVEMSLWSIWDYGKNDRFVVLAMARLLEQLIQIEQRCGENALPLLLKEVNLAKQRNFSIGKHSIL